MEKITQNTEQIHRIQNKVQTRVSFDNNFSYDFFFFLSQYTLYNQIRHTYNVWNSVYYTRYCLCVCTE